MDKLHEEKRKQFEEWASNTYGDFIDIRRSKNGDNEYMTWDVGLAWMAWQAARKSIAVELPTEHDLRQVVCSECASERLELVESRIRSICLSIKGE